METQPPGWIWLCLLRCLKNFMDTGHILLYLSVVWQEQTDVMRSPSDEGLQYWCVPLLLCFTLSLQEHFSNECKFLENLLANNYNVYESAAYPGMYVGLSKTGKAKRGNRVTQAMTMTHFLPRVWKGDGLEGNHSEWTQGNSHHLPGCLLTDK